MQEATCGDVLVVHRGGDDDGVLIIPASQVEAVIERGLEAGRREQDTRRSLLSGETLDEIDAARRQTS